MMLYSPICCGPRLPRRLPPRVAGSFPRLSGACFPSPAACSASQAGQRAAPAPLLGSAPGDLRTSARGESGRGRVQCAPMGRYQFSSEKRKVEAHLRDIFLLFPLLERGNAAPPRVSLPRDTLLDACTSFPKNPQTSSNIA